MNGITKMYVVAALVVSGGTSWADEMPKADGGVSSVDAGRPLTVSGEAPDAGNVPVAPDAGMAITPVTPSAPNGMSQKEFDRYMTVALQLLPSDQWIKDDQGNLDLLKTLIDRETQLKRACAGAADACPSGGPAQLTKMVDWAKKREDERKKAAAEAAAAQAQTPAPAPAAQAEKSAETEKGERTTGKKAKGSKKDGRVSGESKPRASHEKGGFDASAFWANMAQRMFGTEFALRTSSFVVPLGDPQKTGALTLFNSVGTYSLQAVATAKAQFDVTFVTLTPIMVEVFGGAAPVTNDPARGLWSLPAAGIALGMGVKTQPGRYVQWLYDNLPWLATLYTDFRLKGGIEAYGIDLYHQAVLRPMVKAGPELAIGLEPLTGLGLQGIVGVNAGLMQYNAKGGALYGTPSLWPGLGMTIGIGGSFDPGALLAFHERKKELGVWKARASSVFDTDDE